MRLGSVVLLCVIASCTADSRSEAAQRLADDALRAPAPTAPYMLAACALFYNEEHYLAEWVIYHRLIGVEHLFLYDHGSTDGSRARLEPYIKLGWVTLFDWNFTTDKRIAQDMQVAHCFNTTATRSARWVAGLDIDEFIVVLTQEPSSAPFQGLEAFVLHTYLYEFEKLKEGAVILDRAVFGCSGHVERPAGLAMQAYTHRVVQSRPRSEAGKVIAFMPALQRMKSYHTVLLNGNWTIAFADHRPWVEHSKFRTFEPVRMAHYQQRSYSECISKMKNTRLAESNWRVSNGEKMCQRGMVGEALYDKTRFTSDTFLAASFFPEVILAVMATLQTSPSTTTAV
jgi:hypothetical protein